MATISYGFGGTNVILANGVTQGAQWASAFASNPAGTRDVAVWTSNAAGTDVVGRLFAGINPRSDEFAVSPPAPSFQTDASIAGLADGRFIVTYTDTQNDPGGDIRARLLDTNGMPAGSIDILVDGIDLDRSDVAALANGGYVVGWIRHDPGGGSDIHMNVYRADGSPDRIQWPCLGRYDEYSPTFDHRTCRRRLRGRLARVARGRRRYRGPFPPLRRHGSAARCIARPDRHRWQQLGHRGRGVAGRRFRRRLRGHRMGQRQGHHGAHLQRRRHGAHQLASRQRGGERRKPDRGPRQPETRVAVERSFRRRMERRQQFSAAGL